MVSALLVASSPSFLKTREFSFFNSRFEPLKPNLKQHFITVGALKETTKESKTNNPSSPEEITQKFGLEAGSGRLSRYISNPGRDHWNALNRVLYYLRDTSNFCLGYGKYHVVLEGYSDGNWISDSDESKSTSGYIFTLGGASISWKPSKHTCIA